MKIVLATNNQGKIAEMRKLLSELPIMLLSLSDAGIQNTPEETGSTYEENALIKAKAAGDASGEFALADDSGLDVEALPGKLGVFSARYGHSDTERIQKLLFELEKTSNRNASFTSCLVLYDPKTQTHRTFQAVLPGSIAQNPRGTQGFGYDPVFIPNGFSQTFAELGVETKNTLSHRAKAAQKLKSYLQQQIFSV